MRSAFLFAALLLLCIPMRAADEPALLAAIRAQPDEDTPRLVYADWLDEFRPADAELAEFIRLEIRLARTPATSKGLTEQLQRWDAEKRRDELLKKNRDTWIPKALQRTGIHCHFDRGFLSNVELSAADLASSEVRAAINELAALQSLSANRPGDEGQVAPTSKTVAESLNSLRLSDLRSLILSDLLLGDEGVHAIDWDRLKNLRFLGLQANQLTHRGLTKVLQSASAPTLTELILWGNPLGNQGAQLLMTTQRLPKLARLHLAHTNISSLSPTAESLPSLHWLNLSGDLGPGQYRNLLASPLALQLMDLNLHGVTMTVDDERDLIAFLRTKKHRLLTLYVQLTGERNDRHLPDDVKALLSANAEMNRNACSSFAGSVAGAD